MATGSSTREAWSRGRYRSANELATHLAFALRELDALRRQIGIDRFFARFGHGATLI